MARDDIPVRLSRIPMQYREGFTVLHRLSSEQANEIASALQKTAPKVDVPTLAATLSQSVSNVNKREINDVVSALLSLSSLQADLDTTASNVAEAVAQTMAEGDLEGSEVPESEREVFKERLTTFLLISSLEVAGKARNLAYEHENVLQEARIMTDIRPVFGTNVEEPPKGAMIVHTLKLSFLNDNQLKDFFVALDRDDVSALQEALQRAESKAKNLQSVLPTNVPDVDYRERG